MAEASSTDIAITAMSCRFPGASSLAAYRDLLAKGRCALRPLSLQEVLAAGVPAQVAAEPSYVRVAAPLERIDEFDTGLFGLSEREAAVMDPQHYHFLECAYEALEAAGCVLPPPSLRVGLFAGADLSYFAVKRLGDEPLWDPMRNWENMLGNDSHFLATSISYRLGLTGPSVGIQTACSTSLVAVHMAVQALIAGDCDAAVAGGASIRGPQTRGYLYREGGILSPTGACRPFDKDADGTVLSSGVGAVVLMRLEDALAGKIPVWAVLKGSGVNNDGKRKTGYTAPSVEGQAAAVAEALSVAGIDPASVGYVETHGTGTRLGDPIEHRALLMAYKSGTWGSRICRIGSVKSNFGHLESAAGVAGLIKAVLSVKFGMIYPSLGFSTANPDIDLAHGPFRVADRAEPFPSASGPRRAGVSSFGIGGTNAHIILEQAPAGAVSPSRTAPLRPFQRRKVWSPPAAVPAPPITPVAAPLPVGQDVATTLARLWGEVTGAEPETTADFLGSGGDSLKATRLSVKLKETLGTAVSAADILDAPDFASLVAAIRGRLEPAAETGCELSLNQQSLWHWQAAHPDSPAYTVQAAYRLKGDIDVVSLRAAFSDLIARQPALRSVFEDSPDGPRQRVLQACAATPWLYEETKDATSALELVARHGRIALDLGKPPLLSVLLVHIGERDHLLSVISHHLVSDEWSAQVMAGDVLEYYRARLERRAPALPPLGADPVGAARTQDPDAAHKLDYWRGKLAEARRFDLPCDRPRPAARAYKGGIVPFRIPADVCGRITSLAHAHRATPFMVLAAAFNTLWARYCGETDLCIGTNIAGRDAAGSTDVVGLFTNTVPLRTDLSGDPTFEGALKAVRQSALEAYEHQLPFAAIVGALQPPVQPARNPFFDVMLVLQNVPRRLSSVPGLDIMPAPTHNGTCKFDLELALEPADDGSLTGRWEYDLELFDAGTVEQFASHLLTLLDAALAAPAERLSKLRLISDPECATLLERWNRTEADFGSANVWGAFTEQARRHGTSPALLVGGGAAVTYAELHARSQALAARLSEAGVRAGDLVGVFCARSERYVSALLAIQACGAAFLPLDPALPDEVLSDILRAAQLHHVATTSPLLSRLSGNIEPAAGGTCRKTLIDDFGEPAGRAPDTAPPADLAYVIYTSGSTGTPKGAMVSRAGMWNHLQSKIRTLGLGPSSRVAQTAPACFDISIWQCLAPLLAGGSAAIISDEEVRDVEALLGRLAADGVTVLELVPSYLDLALGFLERRRQTLPDLAFLVATGERLPVETCRRWLASFPDIPIVNAYGPTECSDDVLQYVIDRPPPPNAVSIPVGHALPNTRVFVLDGHAEPVPLGAVGEICVSGVCVGLGYLNDPGRTAASFLPDPFPGQPGAKLYRTGDLARRRHDGAIEYLGRKDAQVKVRGARIELEEVEAVLRRCAGVGEAAVLLDDDGGSLVAFAVPAAGGPGVDERTLRGHAVAHLPRFVIPSRFLVTDAIPKTPSGKVDRKALQRLAPPPGAAPDARPGMNTPRAGTWPALHAAWCRALGRAAVPEDADFFDIGGDSLRAIRVAALAQGSGVRLTPQDIHAQRTLGALARLCDARAAAPKADDT